MKLNEVVVTKMSFFDSEESKECIGSTIMYAFFKRFIL